MTMMDAVKLMRGPKGTKVTISIAREGEPAPLKFTIIRDVIPLTSVKVKEIDKSVGYIRITNFQKKTSREFREALKKVREEKTDLFNGLIIDLRNNPGGLLVAAIEVSDIFIESGNIVSTRGRIQNQNYAYNAKKNGTQPDYPIVILVNSGSASASEIVAGAMQDHKKAILLGTTTFGKGSVQTIIGLSDGSAMRVTSARYFTPSGRSIQATGIEPDIVVMNSTGKKLGHVREQDLTGHLENEQVEEKKKTEDEKKPVTMDIIPEDPKDDLQLMRAVDLLKGLDLFKDIQPQSAEATE
jgi:carboxyl-terminal processing protease